MNKALYFSIKKHFEDRKLDSKFLFYPKDQVEEHFNNLVSYGELENLLNCIADKFICLNDDGINLNINEAPLDVFMEINKANYDFPRLHLFLSNFDLLKLKLQEFVELYGACIESQVKNEHPAFLSQIEKIKEATRSQLYSFTIRDLKNPKTAFNLQV